MRYKKILFIIPLMLMVFLLKIEQRPHLEVILDSGMWTEVIEVVNTDNSEIDNIEVFFENEKLYIYNLEKGNYKIVLQEMGNKKAIDIKRDIGYQEIRISGFKKKKLEKSKAIFFNIMASMIGILFLSSALLIKRGRGLYLKKGALIFSVILLLDIVIKGSNGVIDGLFWFLELLFGFTIMKAALIQSKLNYGRIKSFVNYYFMIIIVLVLFYKIALEETMYYLSKSSTIYELFFVLTSPGLIYISTIILIVGTNIYNLRKERKRRLWNLLLLGISIFVLMVSMILQFEVFDDLSIEVISGMLLVLTYMLILIRSSELLEGSRYKLSKYIFWWALKLSILFSFGYLILTMYDDLKITLIVLLGYIFIDLIYSGLRYFVDTQKISFNSDIVRLIGADNIEGLELGLKKIINNKIDLEDLDIKIDMNGIEYSEDGKREVFVKEIEGRRVVILALIPTLSLKGFEVRALEELLETVVSILPLLVLREREDKRFIRDNHSLATKLIEIKGLLKLEDTMGVEEREDIRNLIDNEIEILIKEVDLYD